MEMECVNCAERQRCSDSLASWVFFIIGLIATIAIRVVAVLMSVNQIYAKIAWYVGIGGFLIFFVYKYRISQARSKLISEKRLVEKLSEKRELSPEDYNLINILLCSLRSNKEKINFFFIFALSAVALIIALYIDFIR
jgi:hypothetical protein